MGQCDLHTSLVHPCVMFTATVPYFLHSAGISLFKLFLHSLSNLFCGCTENAEILHVRELFRH